MLWIGVAGVLMVIGALTYMGLNGHLTFVVAVATIAGVVLSVMLGCGLFAAAFFSYQSGHEQRVTNANQHMPDEADNRSTPIIGDKGSPLRRVAHHTEKNGSAA